MHTMVNMFLAILDKSVSCRQNQSKCTYIISEYANKLEISGICASSEHLTVYKSATGANSSVVHHPAIQ